MKLFSTEKVRFELAICKKMGRWHEHANSDLFEVDEQGDYINPEIKTLAEGWLMSSGDLHLSSVIESRNDVITGLLTKIIDADLIPSELATKINITKFQNQQYFDQMDYISDAYCALFAHEDHLVDAIDHIIAKLSKERKDV
mgnify:CR=1 FL=1